ncbi:peptidoglycan editing factor PgeF [Kangiella japonica]|uniref:Purine nucleoside phosphorylase n=1 Tax=Kangiella japonica TaxID=647384 RepID=A0ABN0STC7_9GAMM
MPLKLIQPNWPAPDSVKAFCTTREGGCSEAPWDSLNLALHVGDDYGHVIKNRDLLGKEANLPNPYWLEQIHSTRVIKHGGGDIRADGCFTTKFNQSCIVMTADCLPILLTDAKGTWVAAVHAGWRGLADGIIQEAVAQYSGTDDLLAWIGPAISQEFFEVGDDVREQFTNKNKSLAAFFEANPNNRWQCDLSGIAQYLLSQLESPDRSINIYQSGLCSYKQTNEFFSHRRKTHEQGLGAATGRMASAIWIEHQEQ